MHFAKLEEILVTDNRQREEFDQDALNDLIEDIATNGLFHPLVVRATGTETTLGAGERRLRALRELHEFVVPVKFDGRIIPLDTAPVVTLGELSELDALEAELSENIKRADLTWQERDKPLALLHELRSKQAAARGETHTTTATMKELGLANVTNVREAITVAEHLHVPEVAKAATRKEALKVIERKRTEEHNVKLATDMGRIALNQRHTLLNEECLGALRTVPEGTFDAICTDPPYGIGADSFGEQSDGHQYDDSLQHWHKLMPTFALEAYRVGKPQAHAYVFCDPEMFVYLKAYFLAANWTPWRTPLVWVKNNGTLPRPEHGPRRQYETILYAIKGDKKVTAVWPDVITCPAEHTTTHPAQKPVGVYVDLLRRSTRPGDIVADPFAGSGTIFPACNRLNLRAWACEQVPNAYGECLKRLEEK